jgi:hypothetical protein
VQFTLSVKFLGRRVSVPPRAFPDFRKMSWRMTGIERGWLGQLIHALRQESNSIREAMLHACRVSQTAHESCQKYEWKCPLVVWISIEYNFRSVVEEYTAQRTKGRSQKSGTAAHVSGGVQVWSRISTERECIRGTAKVSVTRSTVFVVIAWVMR